MVINSTNINTTNNQGL